MTFFLLRRTILAAAAVTSFHKKHNFSVTNIISMDIAETTDWKDVVKGESVPNNKNWMDK